MPRKPLQIPTYRLHKPSGRAFVELQGRRRYLGKHGSQESLRAYSRLISQSPQAKTAVANDVKSDAIPTINQLILRYYEEFARTYYVKNGQPTQEQVNIRHALRFLRTHFGAVPATEFGPLSLKRLIALMIDHGLARTTVNGSVSRVRRMFRWAVSEEILPPAVVQALDAVPGLRKGRTLAREPEAIGPVAIDDVKATLPLLSPVLQAMVNLQLLSGCRPGEICSLRPCDVERCEGAWRYCPFSHKTEHRGIERQIFFGPRAQKILLPFLDGREPETFCFQPLEAEKQRSACRRTFRKGPLTPSQRARKPKPRGRRRPRDRYAKDSFRRAIARTCEKAFPTVGMDDAVGVSNRSHHCAPNRLRHTRAPELRSRFGIDAAAAVLGHADLKATQIYAAKDFEKAASIMTQIG